MMNSDFIDWIYSQYKKAITNKANSYLLDEDEISKKEESKVVSSIKETIAIKIDSREANKKLKKILNKSAMIDEVLKIIKPLTQKALKIDEIVPILEHFKNHVTEIGHPLYYVGSARIYKKYINKLKNNEVILSAIAQHNAGD